MGAHGGSSLPPDRPTGPNPQAPVPSWTLQAPPPQKPRRGSRRVHVTIGALAFCAGFACGQPVFSTWSATSEAAASQPAVTVTARATVTQTVRPKVSRTPKPSPSSVLVDDGTWVVGDDIPAGTYKVTSPVGDDCYWALYKSGTNSETIIANDFPGGGRPVVTVRRGQDFRTARCGSWVKR